MDKSVHSYIARRMQVDTYLDELQVIPSTNQTRKNNALTSSNNTFEDDKWLSSFIDDGF